MRSWPSPPLPSVPGTGLPLRLHDTASDTLRPVTAGRRATMYVCGITPYDATHLGHAATYVTFDLVGRALRDAGHEVLYVQNVTDVDEPLLERAVRDGLPWQALAERETALFREDMTALGIIAPDHYIGAIEAIPSVAKAVATLLAAGAAYPLQVADRPQERGGREGAAGREPAGGQEAAGGSDVYFDLSTAPGFGQVSGWSREQMMSVFAERGGDPDRPGKRDRLDPLLWRAERDGEPSWDGGELGPGRPGWHIECTAIARDYLGVPFDIQGGGTDLVFPHHEMSAVQGCSLAGTSTFAGVYVHQAMVGLHGEKMSKSKGNLVLVSALRRDGVDPMAIRLALLGRHYRTPWDWTDDALATARERLRTWRAAVSLDSAPAAEATVALLRERLADDLDAPGALAAVDRWALESLERGGDDPGAPGLLATSVDALLGVRL